MTYYQPGFAYEETVSATTATPSVQLGARRTVGYTNYVYGYNASNSQINPGVPVVIGSNNVGYSFTLTNAASQVGWMAAVVHNATIATSYYGWFAVAGLSRMVPDATATSGNAGIDVTLGVDGGFVAMTGATLSTGIRWGFTATSFITGYGVNTLTSLGQGWIRSYLAF